MAKSDVQLIAEARTDPDAFGELYRRHVDAIHGFLRARAPQEVSGELTAETFAQAALSLRRFRDEAGGTALPWLYGIARNLLRRYLTKEQVETRARERLGMPLRTYELDLEGANDRLDAERCGPGSQPHSTLYRWGSERRSSSVLWTSCRMTRWRARSVARKSPPGSA
jgi:DNA-directed RNA polymerase specialized sigma24 family protein